MAFVFWGWVAFNKEIMIYRSVGILPLPFRLSLGRSGTGSARARCLEYGGIALLSPSDRQHVRWSGVGVAACYLVAAPGRVSVQKGEMRFVGR